MNSLQNGLCIGLTVNPFSTKEEDSLCKSDAIFCECIFSRKLEHAMQTQHQKEKAPVVARASH